MIEKWEIITFIILWLGLGFVGIKLNLKWNHVRSTPEDIIIDSLVSFGGFFTLLYILLEHYVPTFQKWSVTPFKKKKKDD